ncbi:oligosaccharide flippase family protein [Clostridium sp.]|uniref:oligosaccharide flippase family protein n=1 Tax=Clostridium sp. TaxID=1506 RepID=UPI002FCBBA0F
MTTSEVITKVTMISEVQRRKNIRKMVILLGKLQLRDRRIRDLSYTLGANLISLISGLIITFVIPKMLSIEEYAYFRVFTFYLGYVGVFHFGFNDGIYINYGKYDYDTLPREKFRTYFKFLTIFQSIVAIVVFIVGAALTKDNTRILIYLFLSINIILVNLIGYFEFISQFVRRFAVYSFNLVLSKILYIVGVIGFIFINNNSGMYFMMLQTIVNLIILYIYIRKYKGIVHGKSYSIKELKDDIKHNISLGLFIMLGNFVTIIIIGIDRIFIDKFFSVQDFAMYSFAVSLLSMFYLILNAITTVVYPYLTRSEGKDKAKVYEIMKTTIFVLVGFCLSGYFIFDIIVRSYIPQYSEALKITAIIFPTILLSGEINIVTQNFYKTLKLQKEYTRNNVVAVAISLVTIIIAFLMFKTTTSIAMSSLISFYLWGIYGDRYFAKVIGINTKKHHIGEFLTISLFLYLTFRVKWYIGFILYIILFSIIVAILFGKNIKEIKNVILRRS